ncbi:hypothetical protein KHP11_28005 [Rhodococcus erythropolis]|uniref:hypothetical protein n=1 Tax=Rhodococcus erythropolis TaxID=1833 RepID=UPI0013011AEC|nr:hypothetical protein [Rhodococcus erythropolis]MBT1258306.1 hypothetical protein [Rhodococcus erythropolis]
MTRQQAADLALAISAATVLGVTVGILVTDAVAGLVIGSGTAIVFQVVLRTITPRK